MITFANVVKKFGLKTAVDGISFEVREGETVVLLGTSGCGKTTTLRMINRLTEPSSGEILFSGKGINEIEPPLLRRRMGYVLQQHGLFPHYTVTENIAVVPRLLKWTEQRIRKRTAELLEQLHLPDEIASSYPHELSGGQQQRIGLARALAADPPVLLMDEPFGALDVVTRKKITKEFASLEALKNKTVVLVTHDIGEAFALGDRIVLMDRGRIIQQGTALDLLFRPASPFTAAFFADQQLQLELRQVFLKDLMPYLQLSGTEDREELADPELTIWDTIEWMQTGNKNRVLVRDPGTGDIRKADFDSLFRTLDTLKQQYDG